MLAVFANGGEPLRSFVTALLKTADVNISGYKIDSSYYDIEETGGAEVGYRMTAYTLRTNHIVTNDDMTCEYTLPFDAESEGTKRIFISARS